MLMTGTVRRMYRYTVPIDDKAHVIGLSGDPVSVAVAGGGNPLRAFLDAPEVEFWAEHDESADQVPRAFRVFGTGHPLPEGAKWTGTCPPDAAGPCVPPVRDPRGVLMTETETAVPSLIALCRTREAEIPFIRWDGSEGAFAILKLWGAEPARWTADPPGGVMVRGVAGGSAVASPGDLLVRDRRGVSRYGPGEFARRFEVPGADAPSITPSGGEGYGYDLLLERAQKALAFERERAEAAEAKAALCEGAWHGQAPPPGSPLLTCAEVAGMWRVDVKTVARWAKEGRLGSVRTPGGGLRFPGNEVRALLRGEGGPS
jgi:excisionase family DNA binding protein